MIEPLPIAYAEKKLYNGTHMLHRQKFDPNLPYYKDNIRPNLQMPQIPQLGPAFYFLYDFHAQHHEYVSDEVEKVLGYPPVVLKTGGIKFVKENMAYQDSDAFTRMVLRATQHLRYEIPREERAKYSVSFDYRFKHADGKVLHLLQQSLELAYDREGNLVFSLEKVTDISHRPSETGPMLSIYGPDPKHSLVYYPAREQTKGHKLFTRSEMRVLQLLDKAHSTQEIAHMLNLSSNTIATHRKNMLKKARVSDTPKLLRFARRKGILS
jgi:DNA-binding CsgD family transcriptional regulator